ncbi:MAG: hypothetical protein R3F62_26755 [Planctomycetota bacterium]
MRAELGVGVGALVLVLVGGVLWLVAPGSPPSTPASEPTPATVDAPEAPEEGPLSAAAEERLPIAERVARVLERARKAQGDDAEAAASAELELLLHEFARGDAIGNAQQLLAPELPSGVQEVGARLLNAQESPEARAARQRAVSDPRLAAPARLLLIYDVAKRADEAAHATLWTVVENPQDDPEVRAFALDVVGQGAEAAPRLRRLIEDAEQAPLVRAWAYQLVAPTVPDEERATLRATLARDPEAAAALTQLGAD